MLICNRRISFIKPFLRIENKWAELSKNYTVEQVDNLNIN
jgi:hypothetical protein